MILLTAASSFLKLRLCSTILVLHLSPFYIVCTKFLMIKSRIIPLIGIASLAIAMAGCVASSPRFVDNNNGSVSNKPRFSFDETPSELKVEKEEEEVENDHQVNISKLRTEIGEIGNAPAADSADYFKSELMRVIDSYLGTPYRIGGDTHSGMDCSGFSMVVFDSVFNIPLPHNAREQSRLGERVSKDDLRVGDLVFFRTVGRRISHVGIYLGDGLFANASVSEGVTISSLDSTYYKRRYAGARKLVPMDITNGLQ